MKQKKYTYAMIGLAFLSAAVTSIRSSAQGIQLAPSLSLSTASNTGAGLVNTSYIVAIVNSEPITNNEIRARLVRYERRLAEQGIAMSSRSDLSREILEDIIRERLQLKLARDIGIRVDERAIDAALQNFATQNNISLNELSNRKSVDGIGLAQIRADIQNQLTIQKLREREVMAAISISENDIDGFIKEQFQSEQASSDWNIDLAQILIAVPENATAAKVQASLDRASRLLTRARNGEDFFKLAIENSEAKDANTGGQMGLKSVARYPTLFTEATQELKEGEFAGPIRSGAGFHILKVLTKQLPNTNSYSVQQTKAKHILLRTTATLTEGAAKERLVALKKRIDSADISFETAAKDFSQDSSASSGGDLGWANPGQFVPEFEDVMRLLPIGKVSDPIVTRFGVHLLLVQDRRKALLSHVEQRELARNVMREKKFEDTYNKWITELRNNAYVEYRDLQQ